MVDLHEHNRVAYEKIKSAIVDGKKKIAIAHATGTGKSYLIAKLFEDYRNDKKLVLVPSTYISDQIKELFEKYSIQNVDVILYQKLIKMSDEDIVAMDYGVIALDEYHHDTSKVRGEKVKLLIDTHSESIIFGTSATPIRSDGVNTIDELFEGNCASDLSLSESIAKKIVPLPKYVGALYTLDDELEKLRKKVENATNTNRIMRTIAFHDCWERQYHNSVLKAIEKNKDMKIADYPQEDLMKISLSGIKYINSIREIRRENEKVGTDYVQTLEEAQIAFQLIDAIFTVCGYLILRNFVTTFPVDKYYKGAKWEEKDYFYTMEVLRDMDWDKPIGRDKLSELLLDYENEELRHAYIEFTTAMSAIYRAQTGKGIAEKFFEDRGVPVYTMDKETGIMKNNQTGDIIKPKKVSHLQIVK